MDHRERIESPSHSRNKMIEKRMEMIALLLNSQVGEEDKGREAKKKKHTRKTSSHYSGYFRDKQGTLAKLASRLHHMFL
jgi:hypothetical protein